MRNIVVIVAAAFLSGCGGGATGQSGRDEPPPIDRSAMNRAMKSGNRVISQRVSRLGKVTSVKKGDTFLGGAVGVDDVQRSGKRMSVVLKNRSGKPVAFFYLFHYFLKDGSEVVLKGGGDWTPARIAAGKEVSVESAPLKFGAARIGIEIRPAEEGR